MKTTTHPEVQSFDIPNSQDYQVGIDHDVYTECFGDDIDLNQTSATSQHVEAHYGNSMITDSNMDSMQELLCARNELIVDLMQDVLPSWIRKRWISMLMEMDLATSITDEKITRLCKQSSCARGNLRRLLPDVSCEYLYMADTELLLLTNGFNELANSWRNHKQNTTRQREADNRSQSTYSLSLSR